MSSGLDSLFREYEELPEFVGYAPLVVNKVGGWGSTPLHIAIHRRSLAEVKILLNEGADPNSAGELGNTPLHIAIGLGEREIVRLLLEAGGEVKIRNNDGRTANDLAKGDASLLKLLNEIRPPPSN
jgi:ankyrin repeat protein